MTKFGLWLLSLIVLLGIPSPWTNLCCAKSYYVTPYLSHHDCPPEEKCYTINEYAQEDRFTEDFLISLYFLGGVHNLTVGDFVIENKVGLEIVPAAKVQTPVTIQLSKNSGIQIQSVLKVELSGPDLLVNQKDKGHDCLFLSVVYNLTVKTMSIESCRLTLRETLEASLINFNALTSSVYVSLNESGQLVPTSPNSTLRSIDNTCLSINSSTLTNSFLMIELKASTVYQLEIFNSSIISETKDYLETGVKIEILGFTTLYADITNSTIIGNHQGINVSVYGNSFTVLNVEYCYIARNGYKLGELQSGGIIVSQNNTLATTITKIVSTILSENKYPQLCILRGAGNAEVTLLNSLINNTHSDHFFSRLLMDGIGALFEIGKRENSNPMLINLTQSEFTNNKNAVVVQGEGGAYKLNFDCNTVSSNYLTGVVILSTGTVTITKSKFSFIEYAPIYINSSVSLTVTDTAFKWNQPYGILIYSSSSTILITNSTFSGNYGSSILVEGLQQTEANNVTVRLGNVKFFNNNGYRPETGIVQVSQIDQLWIEDSCEFTANVGSPVQVISGSVAISGAVTFKDNVAIRGGAISLMQATLNLHLLGETSTTVLLQNNTAYIGGSIYIEGSSNTDYFTGSSCFYTIVGATLADLKNAKVVLKFINNTAYVGGVDIYGAALNSNCFVALDNNSKADYGAIRDLVFQTQTGLSAISSDPKRVCLCNSNSISDILCTSFSHIFYYVEHYPGEVFTMSLAVVGFEFGTVIGPVYAKLITNASNSGSVLGNGLQVDERAVEAKECVSLNYTVFSNSSKETIVFTSAPTTTNFQDSKIFVFGDIFLYLENGKKIPSALLTVPVYLEVKLLDCPLGFQLTSSGRCDCLPFLRDIGVTNCSIYEGTSFFIRKENQWILNSNGTFLSSKHCPYDYCKQETVLLNISEPDKQCALNRTGILCGACPRHLSMAIGSSRCVECLNNYWVFLVLAFAAAGLVLVLFIHILNVTVTTGTINGLIFYANIVWGQKSVLFPTNGSWLFQILKVFISWLNLDLGIETCFIRHLDGYWKVWLQFIFPFYLWIITGLIIAISHYSTRATKLLGNNAVSLIATLSLLSYAKLTNIILIVLRSTYLNTPNGTELVWAFDGNVSYASSEHIVLLVFALVILIVLWLPATLSLLFIQLLRRKSHYFIFRWVNKWNPVFDSFLGPFNNKHQYWIGLGFIIRLAIQLISDFSPKEYIPMVLITLICFLLGLLVLNAYRYWLLSALEACFLVNLVMFTSGALFIEGQGGSKEALACTSVGITFVLFLAIIGYHLSRKIRCIKQIYGNDGTKYEDVDSIQASLKVSLSQRRHTSRTTYQSVSVREPLLESDPD